MNGYLQITYVDHENNRFVELGGAAFTTMAETRRQFARIPSVPDSDIILDLCRGGDGPTSGIVGDKAITRATAEALMGESFEQMLDKAAVTERRENGES